MFKGIENKVRAHAREELIERLAKNDSTHVEGIGTFTWVDGGIHFISEDGLVKSVASKRESLGRRP